MDFNIVTQMLGVIAQSYAGILAIGVAFFTILIEMHRRRTQNLRTRIMEKIEPLTIQMGGSTVYRVTHLNLISQFRNEVLEKGISFSEWLNTHVAESYIQAFLQNYEYEISEIERLLKERQSLNESEMPTIWFILYCLVTGIVFANALGMLFRLSMGYGIVEWQIRLAFYLSVLGIMPIIIFGWKIGSMFRTKDR